MIATLSMLAVVLRKPDGLRPAILVDVQSGDLASIAVAAKLPAEWGAKDQERLEILLRASLRGTRDFGRSDIADLTEGRPVLFRAMPDAVLLSFSVRRSRFSEALALADDLMKRPTLSEPDVSRIAAERRSQTQSSWNLALFGTRFRLPKVDPVELRQIGDRLFRRDTVQLAFASSNPESKWEIEWQSRCEKWVDRPLPRYPDVTRAPEPEKVSGPYRVLELRGEPIGSSGIPGPTILAMFALGVGKHSPLFQIPREQQGWSYRQEAILWPISTGWQGRLLVASAAMNADRDEEAVQRAEDLRTALANSVSKWTEADRVRAVAMAKANLGRGLPWGPIYLGGRAISGQPQHHAELAANWSLKLNRPVTLDQVKQATVSVSLEELKTAALEFLATANGRITPEPSTLGRRTNDPAEAILADARALQQDRFFRKAAKDRLVGELTLGVNAESPDRPKGKDCLSRRPDRDLGDLLLH